MAESTVLMSNVRGGSSIPRISALTSSTSSSKTLYYSVLRSFLTSASVRIFSCSRPIIVGTVSWFDTFCNGNITVFISLRPANWKHRLMKENNDLVLNTHGPWDHHGE